MAHLASSSPARAPTACLVVLRSSPEAARPPCPPRRPVPPPGRHARRPPPPAPRLRIGLRPTTWPPFLFSYLRGLFDLLFMKFACVSRKEDSYLSDFFFRARDLNTRNRAPYYESTAGAVQWRPDCRMEPRLTPGEDCLEIHLLLVPSHNTWPHRGTKTRPNHL